MRVRGLVGLSKRLPTVKSVSAVEHGRAWCAVTSGCRNNFRSRSHGVVGGIRPVGRRGGLVHRTESDGADPRLGNRACGYACNGSTDGRMTEDRAECDGCIGNGGVENVDHF